ncbi:hypothetical protein GCM10027341_34850 [Spirosoma knui]
MRQLVYYGLLIVFLNGLLAPNLRAQSSHLSSTHYKYRVVERLCQQLSASFGESRLPRLIIISDPKSRRIAQFVPKPEPTLFLDEKLYDLCRQFEPDSLSALALVLGHELTHYYEKHADWFGFAQMNGAKKPTKAQYERTQWLEAQADLLGFYHAFLVGYDARPVSRKLYTAIYEQYQLPDQMAGYPSRTERITQLAAQAAKANTLGMAFDAGVFFFLNQQYSIAERCFTHVLDELPTKELLNNLGLCRLLSASHALTLREMPFRLPFELATDNRLRPEDNRGSALDKVDALKRAVSYFQHAIELDNQYVTGYINQASALVLLGRNGSAKEVIDELESVLRQTKKSLPANARLVRAIALLEAGKATDATAELALSRGAHELAYNQTVANQYAQLQKADPTTATLTLNTLANHYKKKARESATSPEHRGGAVSLPLSASVAFTEQVTIPEPLLVRIQGGHTQSGFVYRIRLADVSIDLLRSQPGTVTRSVRGIKSGDSVQALIAQYGEPQRLVSAGNDVTYYCYHTSQFFVAVQYGQVRNWFVFATQ